MTRIINCEIAFGEFDLACAKCGKTILTVFSPEYAPVQLRHRPMTCNADGSHSFAGEEQGDLTFLVAPKAEKKEAGWPEMGGILTGLAGVTEAFKKVKDTLEQSKAGAKQP